MDCLRSYYYYYYGATPVIHPPRRVPVTLHGKLKQELGRMETFGVIVKQAEPTNCVNNQKHLSRSSKRKHLPMMTVEDVMSRILGTRSVLDAESGFW